MMLNKNEEIAVKALKEQVSSRYPVVDFRIFGSKARGDGSPYSDIDVMIEIAESNPNVESEIYDTVFDINLEFDCFISVIIFTRGEIEEGPLSESPIYKVIMREGVSI